MSQPTCLELLFHSTCISLSSLILSLNSIHKKGVIFFETDLNNRWQNVYKFFSRVPRPNANIFFSFSFEIKLSMKPFHIWKEYIIAHLIVIINYGLLWLNESLFFGLLWFGCMLVFRCLVVLRGSERQRNVESEKARIELYVLTIQ